MSRCLCRFGATGTSGPVAAPGPLDSPHAVWRCLHVVLRERGGPRFRMISIARATSRSVGVSSDGQDGPGGFAAMRTGRGIRAVRLPGSGFVTGCMRGFAVGRLPPRP